MGAAKRRPSKGATSAISAMSRNATNGGALRSGKPWMAVQIAFAWTSAPDIRSPPPTGVACTSRSVGADAPTTAIRSRNVPGAK